MNKKLGMAEFFAMEAGEYLERLDALVSGSGVPDPPEFQRLTRALRGAALMANQHAIAQAAGALEQLARTVREGQRPWGEATRQLATRAVDDLKIFVRRIQNWTDDDTAKARDLAAQLEAITGRPSRPVRKSVAGPDSGTRAFVAREGASLASALDRAGKALAQNPLAHDPLQAVLNVMQPLRGLASLQDLPPMSDLLEGIEWAVAEAGRGPHPKPEAPDVFDAAARALSHAAREIASDGKADIESDPVRQFAELLGRLLQLDRPVAPIESLYYDDAGPHIVEQGTPPEEGPVLGEVDLVSHGDHLKQVAEALDEAATPTQRTFRVYALAETLRALEESRGGSLVRAAGEFARAVQDAIGRGTALSDPAAFSQRLREASNALSAAAGGAEEALAGKLREVAAALSGAPAAEAAEAVAEVVPPPATPAVAPAAGETEGPGLSGSLMRYWRYVEALGLEGASLDELIAGPPADPGAAAPAEPAAPVAVAQVEAEVIPITALCYSGPAALERAISLRDQVTSAIASGVDATDLIEEVFDLVQLGLATDR